LQIRIRPSKNHLVAIKSDRLLDGATLGILHARQNESGHAAPLQTAAKLETALGRPDDPLDLRKDRR